MDSLSTDRKIHIAGNVALTKRATKERVTIHTGLEKLLFLGDKSLWRTNWYWRLFQAKGIVELADLKQAILDHGYQHAKLEHTLTVCQEFQTGYLPKIIGLGYVHEPYIVTETGGKREIQEYPDHLVLMDNIYVLGVRPIKRPTLVRN